MAIAYRRILGRKIRFYRTRTGLSQEKLAEKAGLSYKYLGEVERGDENISFDALMRVVRALGVRLRDLVREL